MPFAVIAFLCCLLLAGACKSKDKDVLPCNNKGSICFTNKTDSTVRIFIKEVPDQFNLDKDNIRCVSLDANAKYSVNISGKDYNKDTSFMVQVCDNKEIVFQN
jgi:hypothetical protein